MLALVNLKGKRKKPTGGSGEWVFDYPQTGSAEPLAAELIRTRETLAEAALAGFSFFLKMSSARTCKSEEKKKRSRKAVQENGFLTTPNRIRRAD